MEFFWFICAGFLVYVVLVVLVGLRILKRHGEDERFRPDDEGFEGET